LEHVIFYWRQHVCGVVEVKDIELDEAVFTWEMWDVADDALCRPSLLKLFLPPIPPPTTILRTTCNFWLRSFLCVFCLLLPFRYIDTYILTPPFIAHIFKVQKYALDVKKEIFFQAWAPMSRFQQAIQRLGRITYPFCFQ